MASYGVGLAFEVSRMCSRILLVGFIPSNLGNSITPKLVYGVITHIPVTTEVIKLP